jgi:hypothetical protein
MQMPTDHAARDPELGREAFDGSAIAILGEHGMAIQPVDIASEPPRLALTALLDAVLMEVSQERGATDSRLIRQAFERHAVEVATDQVIEIRDVEFRGHVYDLMTESGIIIAGGILVRNCTLLYYNSLNAGASSIEADEE